MSTNNNRESSLIRKLQAARLEQKAAKQKTPVRPTAGKMPGALGDINEEVDEVEEVAAELRKKELESQKARIVAQMVPGDNMGNFHDQENDPPLPGSPPRFKDKARTNDTRGTREPRESKNAKAPARPCTSKLPPLTLSWLTHPSVQPFRQARALGQLLVD